MILSRISLSWLFTCGCTVAPGVRSLRQFLSVGAYLVRSLCVDVDLLLGPTELS